MSFLTKHRIALTRAVILSVGITLITLGILRGELSEILQKAVVVCLECIGIA